MKNIVLNNMNMQRQSTAPLDLDRTLRKHDTPLLAKLSPGLAVPIAQAGMLREDAVNAGQLTAVFTMSETAEILINPVHVKVEAWMVPFQAFERFNGRDEFEASYAGQPFRDGEPVTPFIETMSRGVEGDHPVLDALGLHAASDRDVSTMQLEAYNLIINHRNKNLSPDLPERTRLDSSFAPAQREIGRHRNIVPNFDQAAMDGAVDIELLNQGQVPVTGIGVNNGFSAQVNPTVIKETDGDEIYDIHYGSIDATYMRADGNGRPMVYVNLEDAQARFSLANIEKAKNMQFFAQLRKKFAGHDDDWIIENLMNGLNMPEKMFDHPIYMGSEMSAFLFNKRYSSDSQNLDESVVHGVTQLSMQFATPRIPTGGVIMFIAEVQPEMLFERQTDPFFVTTDVDQYPQFQRDFFDEQQVDVVLNEDIDSAHTGVGGLFGYTYMNSKWNVEGPRIGTGYFQPEPSAVFDEDRNRIWDTSPSDPTLGDDWYLTTDVNQDVFEYTDGEPYEVSGRLQMIASGLTVFGRPLIEGDGDYEKISEIAPSEEDQIDQNP